MQLRQLFPGGSQASEVLEPAESPFDLPAVLVMLVITLRLTTRFLIPASNERTDQPQAAILQSSAQTLTVGHLVKNKTAVLRQFLLAGIQQRFDQSEALLSVTPRGILSVQ